MNIYLYIKIYETDEWRQALLSHQGKWDRCAYLLPSSSHWLLAKELKTHPYNSRPRKHTCRHTCRHTSKQTHWPATCRCRALWHRPRDTCAATLTRPVTRYGTQRHGDSRGCVMTTTLTCWNTFTLENESITITSSRRNESSEDLRKVIINEHLQPHILISDTCDFDTYDFRYLQM